MGTETAKCGRCGREIAITDSEYSAWEVIGEIPDRELTEADPSYVSCEACLTPAEVAAILDDAMEMAESGRCLRCGRDPAGMNTTAEGLATGSSRVTAGPSVWGARHTRTGWRITARRSLA
jgi:DNA-directed RNA polymerase subunit RPC12/RpoP